MPTFAPSRLRLAVDAYDLLRDQRGIGRYLRAVLVRFARTPGIELTLLSRALFPARQRSAYARLLGVRTIEVRGNVPPDADVVWHPWNGTFVASAVPAVVTLHDAAPFAYPAARAALREAQQAPFRRSAASTAAIICDSSFSAAEAGKHLGIDPRRIQIVPLGVEPEFSPGPADALPTSLRGRTYVLHVGAHDEHKNLAVLARAHADAFPDGSCALVLTRRNPAVPHALVCEHARPDVLLALYRSAALVAVPSVYEGFGLPMLEAMACGTPVLAARAASLPEVGGEAVRYVEDPLAVPAWSAALRALISDAAARRDLAARGIRQAAPFTWERCAEATLAVLRRQAAG